MEFKKYFVDEFNYLFEISMEHFGNNDDENQFTLYYNMPEILQSCFLNSECPDEYIREVLNYPRYMIGIFDLRQYKSIDEFIEFIHLHRKEKFKKEELKTLSKHNVCTLAKNIIECDESTLVEDMMFFRKYKIFKDFDPNYPIVRNAVPSDFFCSTCGWSFDLLPSHTQWSDNVNKCSQIQNKI